MLGLGNILTKGGAVLGFPNKYSFNFDGSNDYLDLPITFSYTNHTISAWYYANSGDNYIFDTRDSSGDGIALGLLANGIIWYAVRGSGSNSVSSSSGSFNSWNHVAVTYNGSTAKIYLNGSEVGSGTFTDTISTTTNARIGALSYSTSGYFDGLIDEVAFWDTALSADDVVKIASKPVDFSKASTYATDRTSNLKLWLRAGDKAEPESTTAIARQDFYTDFDGTDDYVSVADNDDLSFGSGSADSPLSISAWINPVDATNFTIVSKGVFNTDAEYIFQLDGNDKLYFALYDESVDNTYEGAYFNTALTSYQGSWFHVCATYNGVGGTSANAGIKLYIDGVEKSTILTGGGTYVAMENLGGELEIGRIGSTYSDGKISNLAVYQTELDAQTISQMAKSRFTPMRDNRFSVVDFDGSNDYIATNANTGLSDATYTFWAKSTVEEKNLGVFGHGSTTTSGFHIWDSDSAYFQLGDSFYRFFSFTDNLINDGVFHHFAIVADTSDISACKLYIDGVETTTSTTVTTGSATSRSGLEIGRSSSADEWEGSISQFAVYSDLKDDEFIYAQWSKGITADYSNDTNLTGYWRMGDGAGDNFKVIRDQSSNSNDGEMTNMALEDIQQQMVAGYDLGAYDNSSENYSAELVADSELNQELDFGEDNEYWVLYDDVKITGGQIVGLDSGNGDIDPRDGLFNKIGIIAGTLYKITIDVAEGTFVYRLGTSNNSSNTGFHNYSTQDTKYFLPTTDGDFNGLVLGSQSTAYKLNSISIKEVLQSEVSDTYPAIIDVNEPVLGLELITNGDFELDSNWADYNTPTVNERSTEQANGGTYSRKFTADAISDGIQGDTFSVTAGNTYKVSVDVYPDDNTQIRVISRKGDGSHADADNSYTSLTQDAWNTLEFTYVAQLTGSGAYILILSKLTSGTYYIDNVTVKEIQGNVGTMTNQDSSDLVYSSVLPDQSFLTGVNSAYNFIDLDGSDEYIDCGDIDEVDGASALSISAWIKCDVTSGSRVIVSKYSSASVRTEFFVYNNLLYMAFGGKTGNFSFTSTDWNHVAMVFDGSGTGNTERLKMYLNGESQTLTYGGTIPTTTSDTGTNVLKIGNRTSFSFDGAMGQVSIFNKALSSTEVNAINTAGRHSNLLDSYSDNLVGYWAMGALDAKTGLSDVGDGTIYDRSGNSNHGTATNTESADLKSSPNAEPNGYAKGDTNRSTTTP